MLKVIPLSSLVKASSDAEPKSGPFKKLICFRNEGVQLLVAFCADTDCDIDVKVQSKLEQIKVYWVQEIYSKNPVHILQDNFTLRNT